MTDQSSAEDQSDVLGKVVVVEHQPKIWTPTFILLVVAVTLQSFGLLGIWVSSQVDARRANDLVVRVDCNNADRLTEISEGVAKVVGVPKDSITIKPCASKEKP